MGEKNRMGKITQVIASLSYYCIKCQFASNSHFLGKFFPLNLSSLISNELTYHEAFFSEDNAYGALLHQPTIIKVFGIIVDVVSLNYLIPDLHLIDKGKHLGLERRKVVLPALGIN